MKGKQESSMSVAPNDIRENVFRLSTFDFHHSINPLVFRLSTFVVHQSIIPSFSGTAAAQSIIYHSFSLSTFLIYAIFFKKKERLICASQKKVVPLRSQRFFKGKGLAEIFKNTKKYAQIKRSFN
ncbi:MAG: hypothetical protein ACI4AI_05450 [Paludibacteraceae bacterium]